MANCPQKTAESAQLCCHDPSPASALKAWLHEESLACRLQVRRIGFTQSRQWQWDTDGFLSHYTKRFFRVVGVRYFSVFNDRFLTQPIIDQPEIGLLSFLACRENQEWWILAHAKAEPGNVNGVQLAPTVQATKSNYEIAHGGAATPYLEWVKSNGHSLCDQLQSEQNSRFFAKRNRNSVIALHSKIQPVDSRYRWIRLRELLLLLKEDHAVNTDARSVLTCWLFTDASSLMQCLRPGSVFGNKLLVSLQSATELHSDEHILDWLDSLNRKWKPDARLIRLKHLEPAWECGDAGIVSPDDPAMIHQIEVQCFKREVSHWDQPIAASRAETRIVLIMGSYRGSLHLLLQARLEAGNRHGFELTTTIQSEMPEANDIERPYLKLTADAETVLTFKNSEEGGRFDHCVSEYRIARVNQVTESCEGPFHRWVSLSQFSKLLTRQGCLTNEVRSAVSSLLGIENDE